MSEMMKIVAGLDIGNGYVKGIAGYHGAPLNESMRVDLPSVVSYKTGMEMLPKEATDEYIRHLDNELDATITSNAISSADEGRMFFGQRAIRSGETLCEFNISDMTSKCEASLSTILILGSLASLAMRMYWKEHHALPASLDVDACIGIALPIEEFMTYRDVYPNKLMRSDHTVMVRNFENDIPVRIHFSQVSPVAEGAAAQFAITDLGAGFLQAALNNARANGAAIDEGYTGEVLASVENTIGIDIGEGNVNFPVYTDGTVNIEASRSINRGYGTVLTNVVNEVRNKQGLVFETRKDLADFMLDTSMTPSKRTRRAQLQRYIDEYVKLFCREVMTEFTSIFRKVGARTDAIYVYGGGANNVRAALYPQLVKAVTYDDGNQSIPVIYLDSSFSRDLNRNGLFQVARYSADAAWGSLDAE